MSETVAERPTAGDERWLGKSSSRLRGVTRRRGVSRLLVGGLLVLGCVGGFVVISMRSDDRQVALALARDVRVGQVLAATDLREVRVAVDADVAVIHADEVSAVVGRPVAASLPAGSLLPPGAVGRVSLPEAGQGIVALALKPGRLPPGLAAGASVSVVPVADQPGGSAAGRSWSAVVVEVAALPGEQVTVVAVQLRESAAREVAAVPAGQLTVVLLPGGGR
ncbi:SAF domain-containing protein [Saccharothrix variisporea]|uniref:SAF domain-containing protein n=1 Tax=Saccharothrix variisporea TaxID=543527 RepID=A0A495X9D0_9PSEU|nr:SAF domain-containing protein [Saccharothrix variisporea]RKT69474.1 hypothetical protein DFJ66_2704 [Saccharothrix variisporea]